MAELERLQKLYQQAQDRENQARQEVARLLKLGINSASDATALESAQSSLQIAGAARVAIEKELAGGAKELDTNDATRAQASDAARLKLTGDLTNKLLDIYNQDSERQYAAARDEAKSKYDSDLTKYKVQSDTFNTQQRNRGDILNTLMQDMASTNKDNNVQAFQAWMQNTANKLRSGELKLDAATKLMDKAIELYKMPRKGSYQPGFEPGGPVEALRKMSGRSFNPEQYKIQEDPRDYVANFLKDFTPDFNVDQIPNMPRNTTFGQNGQNIGDVATQMSGANMQAPGNVPEYQAPGMPQSFGDQIMNGLGQSAYNQASAMANQMIPQTQPGQQTPPGSMPPPNARNMTYDPSMHQGPPIAPPANAQNLTYDPSLQQGQQPTIPPTPENANNLNGYRFGPDKMRGEDLVDKFYEWLKTQAGNAGQAISQAMTTPSQPSSQLYSQPNSQAPSGTNRPPVNDSMSILLQHILSSMGAKV